MKRPTEPTQPDVERAYKGFNFGRKQEHILACVGLGIPALLVIIGLGCIIFG